MARLFQEKFEEALHSDEPVVWSVRFPCLAGISITKRASSGATTTRS